MYDTEQNSPLTIYFRYDPFSWMYFRSAIVVRQHPQHGVPVAQRAFITHECAAPEELAIIHGALQLPEEFFLIRKNNMEQFLSEHRDAPWIESFQTSYLPICEQSQSFFICSTLGLLTHWEKMGVVEALRLALSLKSYAVEESMVVCKPPDHLHRAFCYPYQETDKT